MGNDIKENVWDRFVASGMLEKFRKMRDEDPMFGLQIVLDEAAEKAGPDADAEDLMKEFSARVEEDYGLPIDE